MDRVDPEGLFWVVGDPRVIDMHAEERARVYGAVDVACAAVGLAARGKGPVGFAVDFLSGPVCEGGWFAFKLLRDASERMNPYTVRLLHKVVVLKEANPNSVVFVRHPGVKVVNNRTGRTRITWGRYPLLQYTEHFDYDSRPITLEARRLHRNWQRCGEVSIFGLQQLGPESVPEARGAMGGYCGGFYAAQTLWWPDPDSPRPPRSSTRGNWPGWYVERGRYPWYPY